MRVEDVDCQFERLCIPVLPFDAEQARIASFWKATRAIGMAIGDRACLTLALKASLPALAAESDWEKCPVGAQIIKIR